MNWSSYKNETPEIRTKNGRFFDFILKSGHPVIFDYQNIPEILLNANGTIALGGAKERKEVTSIQALLKIFNELISNVQAMINQNGTYNVGIDVSPDHCCIQPLPFRVSIRPHDHALLAEQLVLDILFDKYRTEAPEMTLRQYSYSHSGERWYGGTDDELIAECVRKSVSASVTRQVKDMSSPKLRSDIEKLGANPEKYFSFLTQLSTPFANGKKQEIVTKPKPVWDYIYYSGFQKLVTSKQYNRSFSQHENYSHKAVADMFNMYDHFVDDTFMQKTENDRDYFTKSLEFYSLEIYKRIDFIYKLALRLDGPNAPIIDKNHPLVKRFVPEVVVDYSCLDGVHYYGTKHKYYRPMLMLEDLWQQQERYKDQQYSDTLLKHHLVRAKAYELFRYHYEFASDSYDEISSFLQEHYNILAYHDPQKVWFQPDKKLKRERDARVVKALEINEALFGKR